MSTFWLSLLFSCCTDGQEPHSTSGSSSAEEPKRITTSRLDDDGDDEDSGDSEHGKHKYTSHSVTFQCFFIIIIILLNMQRGYTLLNGVVLSSPHYC